MKVKLQIKVLINHLKIQKKNKKILQNHAHFLRYDLFVKLKI